VFKLNSKKCSLVDHKMDTRREVQLVVGDGAPILSKNGQRSTSALLKSGLGIGSLVQAGLVPL